jgi:hypothetical protein
MKSARLIHITEEVFNPKEEKAGKAGKAGGYQKIFPHEYWEKLLKNKK